MSSDSIRQLLLEDLWSATAGDLYPSCKFPHLCIAVTQTHDNAFRYESPGTVHKQLTFSQFCSESYDTEVIQKFAEYLRHCFHMYSFHITVGLLTYELPQQKKFASSTHSIKPLTLQVGTNHLRLPQPPLLLPCSPQLPTRPCSSLLRHRTRPNLLKRFKGLTQ